MIRVLFVCTANICRSPMAEAIFKYLVDEAGLSERFEVDSAGIADWEIDSGPHPGTLFLLEEHGISYEGQGRNFSRLDLDRFDYIVTMDEENLRAVKKLGKGRAVVAPLMSFVKNSPIREVPDPYFDNGFETVFMLIRAGSEALLHHIKSHRAL